LPSLQASRAMDERGDRPNKVKSRMTFEGHPF